MPCFAWTLPSLHLVCVVVFLALPPLHLFWKTFFILVCVLFCCQYYIMKVLFLQVAFRNNQQTNHASAELTDGSDRLCRLNNLQEIGPSAIRPIGYCTGKLTSRAILCGGSSQMGVQLRYIYYSAASTESNRKGMIDLFSKRYYTNKNEGGSWKNPRYNFSNF